MSFLQLIRYKNLLLLVFVQVLFSLVISTKLNQEINVLDLVLLIQATVLLAAAGNVINDFFDIEIDVINKPSKVLVGTVFSKQATLSIYFVLNFFGIISGLALAYLQGKILYGLLFVVISGLLFMYSKSFKKIAVLGNAIVSLCIALSIWLLLVFSPFQTILNQNLTYLIIIYGVFAFLMNLMREIIKDIEDIKGDDSQNVRSLPILVGQKKTHKIVFIISFFPLILSIIVITVLKNTLINMYFSLFIILPLSYFMYHIREVKTSKEIHKLSRLLKIIMLFGILSILFLLKTS